jgi:hypothetical protein
MLDFYLENFRILDISAHFSRTGTQLRSVRLLANHLSGGLDQRGAVVKLITPVAFLGIHFVQKQ